MCEWVDLVHILFYFVQIFSSRVCIIMTCVTRSWGELEDKLATYLRGVIQSPCWWSWRISLLKTEKWRASLHCKLLCIDGNFNFWMIKNIYLCQKLQDISTHSIMERWAQMSENWDALSCCENVWFILTSNDRTIKCFSRLILHFPSI